MLAHTRPARKVILVFLFSLPFLSRESEGSPQGHFGHPAGRKKSLSIALAGWHANSYKKGDTMRLWFKRTASGADSAAEGAATAVAGADAAVVAPESGTSAAGSFPPAVGRTAPVLAPAAEPALSAAPPGGNGAVATNGATTKGAAVGSRPEAVPADSRIRAVAKSVADGVRTDSKSLYKAFLNGMYDAIIVADPKGHVIDCNTRVTEQLLYSTDELWDQPVDSVIRGLNPQVLERIRQNVVERRYVMLDAHCRRKDGTIYPAEVAISRIRLLNEGDLVFCVRNIERRRKVQRKLRSEHNAVMNASAAFAVCDAAGLITFANPALCEMWGFTKHAEAIEQNVRSLWQQPAGIERAMELALSGDRWVGTLPALGRQGRVFHVYAAIAPDRDIHTEIVGVVCSFFELPPSA
jgi:PAS domain S-box-containing protein